MTRRNLTKTASGKTAGATERNRAAAEERNPARTGDRRTATAAPAAAAERNAARTGDRKTATAAPAAAAKRSQSASQRAVQREFQQVITQVFEQRIAFNRVLGLKIVSFDPERPRVRFEMRPELVGNFVSGQLHGGVISAVLDVVAGLAILLRRAHDKPAPTAAAQLAETRRFGTIDLRIDYLRPGKGVWFDATGVVMRIGNRVGAVRMELENDSGELIASGAAAYMIG